MEEAVRVSNEIAPEHLELMVENEDHWMNKLDHYGALFMGKFSAEVLGDYGIGPNHTLPTGATCKSKGGLSVFNFLRIRTVLQISDESDIRSSDAQQVVQDSIDLALLEGLHGHARSAQKRLFSLASRNTPTSTNSSLPMTEDALESFFRPDLRFMSDYSPVIPVELLARKYGHDASSIAKLDANENLYATIPEVVSALSSAVKNIPYYPDPTSQTLRSKIANHYDVSVESIVVGSGSDELLELLFKVFLPSTVLVSSPAFGMYAFLSQQYNAKLFQVERSSSNSYELNEGEVLQAIRQHSIKMVLLDSPNNPTGKSVSNEFVESLCRENCIVVVDEAYADFAENSALDVFRLQKFPNLIVLRTFSKWAGLAGLRIGYGFFHSTVARNLMKIKQPYNVNVMAEAAAIACLENKHKMEASIKNIVRERNRLLSQLSMFEGVVPFPSQANFILCKVSPSSVLEIQERLRQQGVFVRCYDNHVVGNCVRISCARSTDSDKVIMAFSKLFPVSQLAPKEFFMGLVYICPNSPQYEAPKAVLFDMDGVLADVSKSYRECIIKTAAFFGVKVSSDDIQNAKNQGNANNDWILTQKLISLNSAGVTQVKIDKVTEKFQEYYLELRHKERLLCSKELLRQLYQSGFKLGIVTGRPREEAEFFLKLHEIQTFFPVLVCMNETKLPKPDAEPVLECLRQLGVDIHDPDETPKAYFIGDTPDDMISAVGCKSGRVVPFGFNAPEPSLFSAGAARVLDSLDDLKYYLRLGDVSLPNARVGEACRVTKETAIRATVNLDGSGQQNISTGVGFLDHMISAFSKHGRFDIDINCSGDLHIDDHHSVEDCALVLGEAFGRALGSKSGIMRYGSAYAPLDEALVRVVVDLSGRPFSDVNLEFTRDSIGNLSCEMIPHFFSSFATSLNATLHVDLIKGKNSHHIAESAFKALALSMRLACSKSGFQDIASTKGTL